MSEAMARGQVYRLLSHVFGREPSALFLEKLLDQSLSLDSPDLGKLRMLLGKTALPSVVEELACEYTRLFIGPGEHLSPHESVARGEGRFWGSATAEVLSIYNISGFTIDEAYRDMPDHLAVEFEFMAHAAEVEARRQGESADPLLLETVQHAAAHFMEGHLLKWVPDFLADVQQTAQHEYYRFWGKFGRAFVLHAAASLGAH